MSVKPIKRILNDAPEFRALTLETRRLAKLEELLKTALPQGIAAQTTVTGVSSGTLRLSANNGPAAAKLRQLSPRLLDKLRREERELNALKVSVQAPALHNPLPKKQIFIDNTGRDALLTLSRQIEPGSLRDAIIRLAGRCQPSDNKQESLEKIDADKDQRDQSPDK